MKLGFIGTGKIASAVVTGICTSDLENVEIYLSPRNEAKSTLLAETYRNVHRMDSNQSVLDHAGIIFIALIPGQAKDILEELTFREDHIAVSLIPYMKISALSEILRPARTICRATPLPAVVYHNCPIQVFNPHPVVERIFSSIGQPLVMESEDHLHAIWTLTGLIAPYYELMEELSRWAVLKGVDKTVSDKYIADMFFALSGVAARGEKIDFKHLIAHATTPNGMNEQAGREIRQSGAHDAWTSAADNLLRRFPGWLRET